MTYNLRPMEEWQSLPLSSGPRVDVDCVENVFLGFLPLNVYDLKTADWLNPAFLFICM